MRERMWKTLQRNKKTLTSLSKSSGLPAHAAAGRPNRPATAARRDTIGPHFKASSGCRSWTVSRTIARMASQFTTDREVERGRNPFAPRLRLCAGWVRWVFANHIFSRNVHRAKAAPRSCHFSALLSLSCSLTSSRSSPPLHYTRLPLRLPFGRVAASSSRS